MASQKQIHTMISAVDVSDHLRCDIYPRARRHTDPFIRPKTHSGLLQLMLLRNHSSLLPLVV